MKKLIYLILLFFFSNFLNAQSNGDYRTRTNVTGNWNGSTIWQKYDGSNWNDVSTFPTNSDGAITVRSGATIDITAAITIDQVVIEANALVIHSASGTVTLNNGTGTDLTILGTWRRTTNSFTVNINSGADISVGDGGIWEHAITTSGGSVPIATWHNNSILRLIMNAAGANSIGNLNQTFGIIEYNRPNQTNDNNDLTPTNVTNELRIISTGTGSVRLQGLNITGSFKQTGGTCKIATSGSVTTVIGGNFSLEGGKFWMSEASGSSNTIDLTVNGTFTLSNGEWQFGTTQLTSAACFLKVKNDVQLLGGTITGWLPGSTGFYFNGTGVQTLQVAINIGDNTRNSFWYQTSSGPSGINETYSGSFVNQKTVTGTRTSPGGTWAAFPTTGTILKTLTVNNNNGLTLTRNMSIGTNLNFQSGILYPDIYSVLVKPGATSTGHGNLKYINGPCSKEGTDDFTFPVGDEASGAGYAPIGISSVGSSSTFKATYFKGTQPYGPDLGSGLDHISGVEYWTLDRTSGSGSANVTLSWADRSGGITNLSDLRVARWTGLIWNNEGNTGTTGSTSEGTVKSSVVSSFSPFTLASASSQNPLPVELLAFEVKNQQNSVHVNWTTASEVNTDYFVVQKSIQGGEWNDIGTKKASGDLFTHTNYFLVDNHLLSGVQYYRLKIMDKDGKFEYSPVRSINIKRNSSFELHPTVTNQTLTVNIKNESDRPGMIEIVNISSGLVVLSLQNPQDQGEFKIDVSGLINGTYLLTYKNGIITDSKIFFKVK